MVIRKISLSSCPIVEYFNALIFKEINKKIKLEKLYEEDGVEPGSSDPQSVVLTSRPLRQSYF